MWTTRADHAKMRLSNVYFDAEHAGQLSLKRQRTTIRGRAASNQTRLAVKLHDLSTYRFGSV